MATIPYQPSFSIQPKHGFRYSSQPQVPAVAPVTAPQAPPKVGVDGSEAAAPATMGAQESYGDDPFGDVDFSVNKTGVAQTLGYQQPKSNIAQGIGTVLGAATGIPFIGGFAEKASESLDQSGKPAYGTEGTYDAQGNIFGSEGRAYDPVTGAPAASYKDKGSMFNTVGEGYSKLRKEGESPISSALGSYDNSIYNISRVDRMKGITPSSKAGLRSTASLLRDNTINEAYGDDFQKITPEMLGFNPMERDYGIPETGLTGKIGADKGDVFISGDSYQPYIVSDTGSLEGQSGTLVQTTNPLSGESVSLLTKQDDGGYSTKGSNEVIKSEIAKEYHPAYGYTDAAKMKSNDDNSSSGGK